MPMPYGNQLSTLRMVLTRSGTVVKRPGVRFKRGSGVRKVLEFDDSGVFSDSDDNLSPVSYTHKPKGY
ncbi:hypothetical protein EB796_011349 [Bugula neritina]|uniref:Uncharacterized protein n=1 Tax=Bugula neritina TaxID=10212 RepID=A0A7J7JXB5_BUGNE|nr:hypothetical protein EB796_011349 [Bugula neritina]